MKKIKFLLLICLLLQSGFWFCQNQKLDSLWKVYNNKSTNDTNKVKTLGVLSWSYVHNNPDTTILLANQQLKLIKQGMNPKFNAVAYNSLGGAYMNKGNYQKSIEYFLKVVEIDIALQDNKGLAACYANMGTVYELQSDYPTALDYALKSLKIREGTKDKLGIANCYGNIGNVYYNQLNFDKALEYYQKDLKLREEIGDLAGAEICYNNLGNVYSDKANYEKALEYYGKSMKLCEQLGDINSLSNCYGNVGLVYSSRLDYSKALGYFIRAIQLKKQIDDQQGIGTCYISTAEAYNKLSNYRSAIAYADSAVTLTKTIGDITTERLAYQILADVYYKTGKFKDAYDKYVLFKQLNDSIFNEDNSKQLGDMKTNFEVEKKETELKLKSELEKEKIAAITKEEKKVQWIITGSVIFGLVLVVIFSVIIFRRLQVTRQQKQIIEEQKSLVELKSRETELQKQIIEEKHKEITDSINYAERIQRSFLASKHLLDENLKDYFVFFQPKDVVSGDFYWAAKLTNEQFALVTADSTGHGVPGAIMSLLNITSLESAIKGGHSEPSGILNATRQAIIERLKKDGSEQGEKDGMDASLICFDFKNNNLVYSAANNPIWIVRNNEILEFVPDKMPVGKHDKDQIPFTQHTVHLQSEDVVYTLTDGMPDQFGGPKGKKFMYKKLKELLITIAKEPMDYQKQKLESSLNDWKGNLEQVDDVCIIGVRI